MKMKQFCQSWALFLAIAQICGHPARGNGIYLKCPLGQGIVENGNCERCADGMFSDGSRCFPCPRCEHSYRHTMFKCRPEANVQCGECWEGYYDPDKSNQRPCTRCVSDKDDPKCLRDSQAIKAREMMKNNQTKCLEDLSQLQANYSSQAAKLLQLEAAYATPVKKEETIDQVPWKGLFIGFSILFGIIAFIGTVAIVWLYCALKRRLLMVKISSEDSEHGKTVDADGKDAVFPDCESENRFGTTREAQVPLLENISETGSSSPVNQQEEVKQTGEPGRQRPPLFRSNSAPASMPDVLPKLSEPDVTIRERKREFVQKLGAIPDADSTTSISTQMQEMPPFQVNPQSHRLRVQLPPSQVIPPSHPRHVQLPTTQVNPQSHPLQMQHLPSRWNPWQHPRPVEHTDPTPTPAVHVYSDSSGDRGNHKSSPLVPNPVRHQQDDENKKRLREENGKYEKAMGLLKDETVSEFPIWNLRDQLDLMLNEDKFAGERCFRHLADWFKMDPLLREKMPDMNTLFKNLVQEGVLIKTFMQALKEIERLDALKLVVNWVLDTYGTKEEEREGVGVQVSEAAADETRAVTETGDKKEVRAVNVPRDKMSTLLRMP